MAYVLLSVLVCIVAAWLGQLLSTDYL